MNIKYFMIFITLLLIFLVLTSPCYADMYAIKDMEGKTICLTNIKKLSQEQIGSGCTISLLFKSSNSSKTESEAPALPDNSEPQLLSKQEQAKIEAEAQLKARIKELENQPKADVVFIDSTNRLSDGKGYYYVEGILKNKGKGTAYNLKLEIQALDKNGKLVSIDYSYAKPSTLAPGKEASYQVMVSNNPNISKFDTKISWSNNY